MLFSALVLGLALVLINQFTYGETITTDQNLTNSTSEVKEFVGIDKDFSLQYPLSWTLEPKGNSSESVDLRIIAREGATSGIITIGYYIVDPELSSKLRQIHANQKEIEGYLKLIFPQVLSGFSNNFDNFNEVEEPNYDKYQIDGHRTGSTVFGFTFNDQKFAGLLVWTLIGGNQFWVQYSANLDTFDQNLPTTEKVLSTIKILNYYKSRLSG